MYAHQRMMYYEIKNFLEKGDLNCRIGILTGIRRIGKTGILQDLAEYFGEDVATYISLNPTEDQAEMLRLMKDRIEKGEGYLFIDEITKSVDYKARIDGLLYGIYNKWPRLKIILSGSSPLHLLAIHYGPLGGSRSKLFRLSFLSFIEYLKFTDRIPEYDNILDANITAEDFTNYLQLANLSATGLKLVFNEDYVRSLYQDLLDSAKVSSSMAIIQDFSLQDLLAITDLISYTLSNSVPWAEFRNPKESTLLGKVDPTTLNLNITGLRIHVSSEQLKNMDAKSVAKALFFLIESGMVFIDGWYEDKDVLRADLLSSKIINMTTNSELLELFDNYNICLLSPVWYMPLAEEILSKEGYTLEDLFCSSLYGAILENYIKGAYCLLENGLTYQSYKIGGSINNKTNEQRAAQKEVDLIDFRNKFLCEITKGNKIRGTNLMKHFPDVPFVRVLTTNTVETSKTGMYKIYYPKVCAMIDNGEILKLERTKQVLAKLSREIQSKYKN